MTNHKRFIVPAHQDLILVKILSVKIHASLKIKLFEWLVKKHDGTSISQSEFQHSINLQILL